MRDPYLYDDCPVLKNKLDIKDEELLENAEVDYSSAAIKDMLNNPIGGNYDFSHLCAVHKQIFNEIYEWAGVPRTIPIEKGEATLGYMSINYDKPEDIEKAANAVLDKMKSVQWDRLSLDEQAKELTGNLAALWKVHPFREGNTRTTVTFVCQFAESQGMFIDRTLFARHAAYTRSALVAASAVFPDNDFRKPEFLFKIVKDSLEQGVKERNIEVLKDKLDGKALPEDHEQLKKPSLRERLEAAKGVASKRENQRPTQAKNKDIEI